jgi:hypothetical protein
MALGLFNPNPIGTDGITFSLWRDELGRALGGD